MGLFNAAAKFSAKSELRESKDEMLMGEIVQLLSHRGFVPDTFQSNDDRQRIRFRAGPDPVLHYLWVDLNRLTGGGAVSGKLVGSKATVRLIGEIKIKLTDPDDLVNMWRTGAANVLKMPLFGDVKLSHRVTSVTALSQQMVDIDDFVLKGDTSDRALDEWLVAKIAEVSEALAPHARENVDV